MKIPVILFFILSLIRFSTYCQELKIPDKYFKNGKDITTFPSNPNIKQTILKAKNGQIFLTDSSVIKYFRLQLVDDSLVVIQKDGGKSCYYLSNIEMITSKSSRMGRGAIVGGCSGLLVGAGVAALFNPQRTTLEWIGDKLDGNDTSHEITKEDVPYILVGAAAGTIIGLIWGGSMKYDKTIFYKMTPSISMTSNDKFGLLLTLRLSF